MNYIGSKYSLLDFIDHTIKSVVGEDVSHLVFCDLFAGTGIVGRHFKTQVSQVIANDWEYYSYILNRNYIGNHLEIEGKDEYIEKLNQLSGVDNGFIYSHYCLGGGNNRQYFSDENGKKIDAARVAIEEWKNNGEISEDLYYFLLCSLIESADKHANTASVYGAFLKSLKKSAQKPMVIAPATYQFNSHNHQVYQEDANTLIKSISGDILYIDPPYNARQYGANYHLLNTIAEYKVFEPKGKTGLREYNKSDYCNKTAVKKSFESLIADAKFKYIVLSYNNEGLMSIDTIRQIMSKYGRYQVFQKKHSRFRADKADNRNHLANTTTEYLHVLTKNS
ncbi:MAG: modification methylase [Rikenellaceae bacterium]|nr:modification methylase [Rikenellaceae bacterium]